MVKKWWRINTAPLCLCGAIIACVARVEYVLCSVTMNIINSGLETPYTRVQPISVHAPSGGVPRKITKVSELIIHVHSLLPNSRSKQRHL